MNKIERNRHKKLARKKRLWKDYLKRKHLGLQLPLSVKFKRKITIDLPTTPNIKIIKLTWWQKIVIWLKNLF